MNDQIEQVDHSQFESSKHRHPADCRIRNLPRLVAFVSAVMLTGVVLRQSGFKPIYTGFFKPRGIVQPDVIEDNPQPYLFTQGVGGTVLLLRIITFILGNVIVGWALTRLVVVLAALNLFAGFCTGCFVYNWLNRLHIPGFTVHPHEQYRDRVQIIKIDASERADLNYWGVLGVLTTFPIDSAVQPRHVNNGVTLALKLRQQLREFAGLTRPPMPVLGHRYSSNPKRGTQIKDNHRKQTQTFLNTQKNLCLSGLSYQFVERAGERLLTWPA